MTDRQKDRQTDREFLSVLFFGRKKYNWIFADHGHLSFFFFYSLSSSDRIHVVFNLITANR